MFKRKWITKTNKYRILLITIISFILLAPPNINNNASKWINYNTSKWINATLFVLLLCSISLNVKPSRYTAWILPIFGLIAIGASLAHSETIVWPMIHKISALAFFFSAIMLFGSNIFSDNQHNLDHLYGSISVYLLIGVAYSYIFMILSLMHPMSLIYLNNNLPITSQFDFYYFSFITLTTVGFGDIVATDGLTKSVVMVESVTGLFYLAILVASLTNLFSKKSR